MINNFLSSLTTSQLFMASLWWLLIRGIITLCCVLSLFTKESFQSFLLLLLCWTSWTWFLILLRNWDSDRHRSLFINVLFSRFNWRILFFTCWRNLLLGLFNFRILINIFFRFIIINTWKSDFLLIINWFRGIYYWWNWSFINSRSICFFFRLFLLFFMLWMILKFIILIH